MTIQEGRETTEGRWLMLLHQIPPKPAYLRVKIWRRLQHLGAVAVKNSVYVLPNSEQSREDFQWLMREIAEGGGEASVFEARFIDGLSDAEVESLFHAARDRDYSRIVEEGRRLVKDLPAAGRGKGEQKTRVEVELARLKRRFAEVEAIDFLGAPGREKARGLLEVIETRLHPETGGRKRASSVKLRRTDVRGSTWVTRTGIHVDRMASGWLIRRFLDPEATFKFVSDRAYQRQESEIRFDMFEAEFTHDGDRCTFEVLVGHFRLSDPALRPIAEIVHDIDVKDSKFGRQDALGLERLVSGIAMAHKEDEVRLDRACVLFDDLYEYFKRKPESARNR